MRGGVGIENGSVIRVSSDAVGTFDTRVDYLDELTGGGAAALWHDEPREKSARHANGGEGNEFLVDGILVEGGDGVEQRKQACFAQGIDVVNTGNGGLSERADGVRLLTVDGDADIFIILEGVAHGAGAGISLVLDESGGQVVAEGGVCHLGDDWVDAARAGGNGAAVQ